MLLKWVNLELGNMELVDVVDEGKDRVVVRDPEAMDTTTA